MSYEFRFMFVVREEIENTTSRKTYEMASLGQAGWSIAAIVPDTRNTRGYLIIFQRLLGQNSVNHDGQRATAVATRFA